MAKKSNIEPLEVEKRLEALLTLLEKKEKSLDILIDKLSLMYESNQKVRQFQLEELRSLINKVDKATLSLKKEYSDHRKILTDVVQTNECVEGTLLNVLVAIRQNEYLHATTPMGEKVVGLHNNSFLGKKTYSEDLDSG